MIISVHIPRTAGSSFRAYLRKKVDLKLIEDYGNPIMVPSLMRNGHALASRLKLRFSAIPEGTDCLHGHFLPIKYKRYVGQPHTHFITWMRDPADRIRSQYDYCFQSDKKIDKSPFQNRVASENWSFEAFYGDSRVQNLYTKFLWNFPISNFDFIGIVEHYDTDFQYFCQHYFSDLNPKYVHGNMTTPAFLDDTSREKIRALNLEDYRLYSTAIELRNKRLKSSADSHNLTNGEQPISRT